jgi:hypothetical protein
VRLVSISEQDASLSEEPENLEITEGQNSPKRNPELFDTSNDVKLNMRTFKRQSSDILLASKYLFEVQPQSVCSMWTKGLGRSFKVFFDFLLVFFQRIKNTHFFTWCETHV